MTNNIKQPIKEKSKFYFNQKLSVMGIFCGGRVENISTPRGDSKFEGSYFKFLVKKDNPKLKATLQRLSLEARYSGVFDQLGIDYDVNDPIGNFIFSKPRGDVFRDSFISKLHYDPARAIGSGENALPIEDYEKYYIIKAKPSGYRDKERVKAESQGDYSKTPYFYNVDGGEPKVLKKGDVHESGIAEGEDYLYAGCHVGFKVTFFINHLASKTQTIPIEDRLIDCYIDTVMVKGLGKPFYGGRDGEDDFGEGL